MIPEEGLRRDSKGAKVNQTDRLENNPQKRIRMIKN